MGLEVVAAIPIGLGFFVSGLIVNFLQLLLACLVLPFSRKYYRIFNAVLTSSYWSQIIWLVEWWGQLKLTIFAEPECWAAIGTESTIVVSNHRSDVDWVVGWILAQRTGVLGTTRALMKQVVKYLPVIGWSMWFSEYIFLARNWAKDQNIMKVGFGKFRDFPLPFWVAIFVEGTRYTPEKLKVAQEFARSEGIYVPQNTLVPRTKGFTTTVELLRDFVPSVLDVTFRVPDGSANPTFGGFFERRKSEMHVHIRRVPMEELPRDTEGISQWCKETFVKKDKLLVEYDKTNSFDPKLILPMTPSPWTIVHTVFWFSLVLGGGVWALALRGGGAGAAVSLSLWQTALLIVVVLVGTGVLLQVLLYFTKSEYSTPMVAAKGRGRAKDKPVELGPLLPPPPPANPRQSHSTGEIVEGEITAS